MKGWIHMFRKKNENTKNYTIFLEKENETLKRKIAQLERERDSANAAQKKSAEILSRYKTEYESLINDSKKLIEKQKNVEKVMDKIVSDCRDDLKKSLADQ